MTIRVAGSVAIQPPQETRDVLQALAAEYPSERCQRIQHEVDRQSFHIGLIRQLTPPAGAVADIGGGTGLFSVGCAAVGLSSILIDDFGDPGNEEVDDEVLDLHRSTGVKIERRQVMTDGLGLEAESMDVVTTFDSMEHWHHSPKGLFGEVMAALKPGGWFLMGVPNCVNLRKRIAVPLGRGKWSSMADWYERPVFRGHVREPDVGDLRYIARDMGLRDLRILGRNWQALGSVHPAVRIATKRADRLLRIFPSLCSDLYLLGQKRLVSARSGGRTASAIHVD